MLMHVRIRENIYIPTEFKTDWCESPITKKAFCAKYKLSLENCDFYGSDGNLITGPELDCEQVTVLQRPSDPGTMAIIGLGLVLAPVVYDYFKGMSDNAELAKRRAENQKALSSIYSYSLRGSTNNLRQYSPIPVVLGKVNATGDKAGLQYSTYTSDNFQNIHQVICLGYSGYNYDVNNDVTTLEPVKAATESVPIEVGGVVFDRSSKYITPNDNQKDAAANPNGYITRIADSPVDTFDHMYVDAQVGVDRNPTYYTERVIEISQLTELTGTPEQGFSPILQVSPYNTIKIRVGIYAPYGYYSTNDNAEKVEASYSYTVQYREVGGEWSAPIIKSGSMKRDMYRNMVDEIDLSSVFDENKNNQYEVRVYRNDYLDYFKWDEEVGQYVLNDNSDCITLSAEVIQFVTRASKAIADNRHVKPIPYPGRYSLLSLKARATDRTNGWLDQVFSEVHLKCRTYANTPEADQTVPCRADSWVYPTVEQQLKTKLMEKWPILLKEDGTLHGTVSPLTLPSVYWFSEKEYGTVYSVTRTYDNKYVVFPRIQNGVLLSEEEAWNNYLNAGICLGEFSFNSTIDVDAFARSWHEFDEWKVETGYNKKDKYWISPFYDVAVESMNNPASLLLYVLTCPQINPRPVKYTDIDWESFRTWWKFCNNRSWTCNAFVTGIYTVAELAELICNAGRAHLVMSNNKYAIAIEDKTSIISQIFTPRNAWNMVETKSLEDPVTLLKVSFVNEETEIEESRYIHFKLNGEGKIDRTDGKVTILFDDTEEVLLQEDLYKSETLDIWGVTKAKQIAQLGAYQLYKGVFLRNTYTWECGLESLSCTVGDVVYLANDIFMSSLGYGRIKDVKKEDGHIVGVYIDESIAIFPDQTYGITIRTGAGEFAQKALFAVQEPKTDPEYNPQSEDKINLLVDKNNSSSHYLQFVQALPLDTDATAGNLFIYNDANKLGKKVLIQKIEPNSDRGATITAVDYIPELYDVDINTSIPEYKSTVNKYGTGANIAGGYHPWPITPSDINKVEGREPTLLTGSDLGGTATCRGVAGIVGDIYVNDDPSSPYFGNLYKCIESGSKRTAVWEYRANIKGKDASVDSYTYKIEYALSESSSVFKYTEKALGYDDNLLGGVTSRGRTAVFGFSDKVWDSTIKGWYKGLYVWTRIKTTKPDGNPVYGEPTYSEEITKSLINGCIVQIMIVDSDGDGDTHTWEKNRAASGTFDIQFSVLARSYKDVASFKSALTAGGGISVIPYKAGTALTPLELSTAVEAFDDDTKLASLSYSLTLDKRVDIDSIVIRCINKDTYENPDTTTYNVETKTAETLNAIDVTTYAQFVGCYTTNTLPVLRPSGDLLVERDYFVAGTDISNYPAGWKVVKADGTTPVLSIDKATPLIYIGAKTWQVVEDLTDINLGLGCLAGIIDAGVDMTDSNNMFYTWLVNLVVQNAVIRNLFAKNIVVGTGTGELGSGFRFRACEFDSTGTTLNAPIFDITYGDITVFKVAPKNGNVFIGQPDYTHNLDANGEPTQPITGFMYRASDGYIISKNENVQIDDDGRIYGNFARVQSYLPFGFEDSLDASYPMECDIYIPAATAAIRSIKISARGLNYRAYSKGAATSTTVATAGVAYDWHTEHWVRQKVEPQLTVEKTSAFSGDSTGSAGKHKHSYDKVTSVGSSRDGEHSHELDSPYYYNSTTTGPSSGESHTHDYKYPNGIRNGGGHTHEVINTQFGAQTGEEGEHTHSMPAGLVKDVSIASFTLTAGQIDHTHDVDISHSHNLTFGIYESTKPAEVSLYIDNGSGYTLVANLGSGENLASDYDITNYISGTGWKRIKFTSSRLGRIRAQIIAELLINTTQN